jgi:hypothetical protein
MRPSQLKIRKMKKILRGDFELAISNFELAYANFDLQKVSNFRMNPFQVKHRPSHLRI